MSRVWLHVRDPFAAQLCLSPEYTLVLQHLMRCEWSVAPLAAACGRPVNATHRRVRRLVTAGLVAETRLEPRRGRPVRHYRAVSDAFLIPYHLTALGSLEDLISLHEGTFQTRFHHAVVHAGVKLVQREQDIALRLYRTGEEVSFDITPRAEAFDLADLLKETGPALTVDWGHLQLTREDAKALQRELHELRARYARRGGPERYLYRFNLAPDLPES
ncbi:hypothetical protein [Deinococcus deserti]|uniref:Uncharacterized protein n=1 Tax=Deinococcus deserti (strain DSM 17065 / CIP 109153 / LMG 22923 / VCD115) TaxID=546414 RepID=C1D055_DEIDV|nr:hypothetical protein [Deinococcus deserti]ACO47324.1 hypothetical protein Deide_22910 [Deinococcus deserti VCD115]